jgi:hypothetical protein
VIRCNKRLYAPQDSFVLMRFLRDNDPNDDPEVFKAVDDILNHACYESEALSRKVCSNFTSPTRVV